MENPTTTLEELFLDIVRESEAHPGRRARIRPAGTDARVSPDEEEESA